VRVPGAIYENRQVSAHLGLDGWDPAMWWKGEATDDRLSVGGADLCECASVHEQRFGARGGVRQLLRAVHSVT
jgi:hypothetical protein